MKFNRQKIIITTILMLLAIPLIAMLFTEEVNWSLGDFFVMGGLLTVLGGTIEYFFRTLKSQKRRVIYSISALFLFILVWMELAVGIFGSPLAGS